MKKLARFKTWALLIVLFSVSDSFFIDAEKEPNKNHVPSLMFLTTKNLFDIKDKPEKREKLRQILKKRDLKIIQGLEFNKQVFEDIDLTKTDLHDLVLDGCTFNKTNLTKANLTNVKLRGTVLNNVNLREADLRKTFSDPNYFRGCVFNNVDLQGALLYGDTKEEELRLEGKSDPYDLVRQYSNLMKKARLKKNKGNIKESEILLKQSEAIKNLFYAIPLNLEDRYLVNFDLTGLNLKNANLKNAWLQGVRLSENVVVPHYHLNKHTFLFNKWLNGTDEEKKIFQNLLNAGFNLFKGVNNTKLQEVDWVSKNLKNANFEKIDLSNCNFIGVNLKEINLKEAYLGGMRLSNNVTVPNYELMNRMVLFDKWINGTDEEKKLFQDLLNAGVNLFKGVSNARLQEVDWVSKNLKNANFEKIDLSNCNFIGVNLKEVILGEAKLQSLRLSENITVPHYEPNNRTPLFEKWLNGTDEEKKLFQDLLNAGVNLFMGVSNTLLKEVNWGSKNLKNVEFYLSDLTDCDFSGVNLQKANFVGAKLVKTNFKGSKLCGATISRLRFFDMGLPAHEIRPFSSLQTTYKSTPDISVKKIIKELLEAMDMPLEEEIHD